MEDGKGQLADGTKYLRESGEDFGPNGFWRRWTCLKGVSAAGKVHCACHSSPQHSFPCNIDCWARTFKQLLQALAMLRAFLVSEVSRNGQEDQEQRNGGA